MNDEIKYFEIRDRGTFIPVMCVKPELESDNNRDNYLLSRAGFGGRPYVFMWGLTGGNMTYDPFDWGNRTRLNAHIYIEEHWDELASGDVVDVEYILGEKSEPKISEQFESYPL